MSDHNNDDLNAKLPGNEPDHTDAATAGPQQPKADADGVMHVESPSLVPGQGQPSKAPKTDAGADITGATQRGASRVMIMAPARDHAWQHSAADDEPAAAHDAPKAAMFDKRRLSAFAAIFVLAATAGVIGGSLATAGLGHFLSSDASKTASSEVRALDDSIRQIGADVAALKASIERSSKLDTAQFAKVNDRIEKVEKAQVEPAAKLAKISETLEKLRVAAATPPAPPAAAKDITGSIPTPVAAPNKVDVNRLPTIEGWRIRDVANGGALVEGRDGLYEVYAGDPLPGIGRVDAIRRQDGRWVVVTSRGLIVAR